MSIEKMICVGKFTRPHGVKGLMCIHSYCTDPQDIFSYAPLYLNQKEIKLSFKGHLKNQMLVQVEGIHSRTEAEALASQSLYVNRDSLPDVIEKDAYYVSDLVEMNVKSPEGIICGHVSYIDNYGAGDVMSIHTEDEVEYLLPFSKEVVTSVNIDAREMILSEVGLTYLKSLTEKERSQ